MIEVFTRSLNDELYGMMREFIPPHIKCHQVKGLDGPTDAATYLHYIIENGIEWVVNVDEDCFIYDWKEVEYTILEMMRYDLEYAGMADGGVSSIRQRSWVVMNPFFNIFHLPRIKKFHKLLPRVIIDQHIYKVEMEEKRPFNVKGPYNHELVSPFNGLFNWLLTYFTPFYLDGKNHADGYSTELIGATKPFCLHSWYGREINNGQRDRITALYQEAKTKKIN